jgi:hypothetical protein
MDRRNVALAFLARGAFVALLVTLLPALATADRHKAGLGGGFVYTDRSDLWGGTAQGEYTLKEWKKGKGPLSALMLSVAADASVVTGRHDVHDFTEVSGLLGPRLTWNTPCRRRCEPFAQVLLGAAHEKGVESRSSLAGAFGIGIDRPFGDLDENAHPKMVIRAQLALHFVDGDSTQWYPQVTIGVVYRINRHSRPGSAAQQAVRTPRAQ